MERYYRFAGLDFLVRMPDDRAYAHERHLAPFRSGLVEDPHCFEFEVVEKLAPPEGEMITLQPGFRVYSQDGWEVRYIGSVQQSWDAAYLRATHRGKEHCVQLKASQYPDTIGVKTVLNAMAAEHLIARSGGFVFHSSYIEWQGRGILFTAPSGTGKSTQAELWRSHRDARIINGDRSAVRLDGAAVIAEGIPFAGSSQYCENRTLPLAAIVYLEQAPVTTIRRLSGREAFFRIWEGCSINTWDPEDMRRVSETVQHVARDVPVYHLACTPDESAVLALEKELM